MQRELTVIGVDGILELRLSRESHPPSSRPPAHGASPQGRRRRPSPTEADEGKRFSASKSQGLSASMIRMKKPSCTQSAIRNPCRADLGRASAREGLQSVRMLSAQRKGHC